MKITFLYDSSEEESRLIHAALSARCSGFDTRDIDVGAQELKPCIGCFGCWIKTPGTCIHTRDGGAAYVAQLYDADYQVLISRILWGGYSPSIKAYADRSIPVLHPFFRMLNGEMHHKLRYGNAIGTLAVGYGAAGPEETATFRELTAAHRDNIGRQIENGTFMWSGAADADSCADWFLQEVGK